MTREINCKLFKCEKNNNRQCCAECSNAGKCLSTCRNTPEKCGYANIQSVIGGMSCPYFIRVSNKSATERKRIVCRGVIPGTESIVCFKSAEERSNYIREFCSGKKHKACPLAKAQQSNKEP